MQIPDAVRAMVDASVDAVAIVDRDLRVVHFNAAYVQLTGLRTRVLRRGEVSAVCHDELGLETCDEGCLAHRAWDSRRPIRLDEVGSHSRDIRLIAVAVPLLDEEGEVYAVVETYRDVTAESRVQNAYRKLLEQERADKLRLAEDAALQLGARNAELREANRKLERASSAKSRFLASVSHEIRTPLAGVIGVAQLLARTELNGDQTHLVHTLVDSGDALLALINNILDLSKIEADRLQLEHAVFHLRDVLDGACTLFAPDADRRGIELIMSVDPLLPDLFRGDAGRLRQTLVNLISNAVKFTESGHVHVRAELDPKEPERVLLSVSDTGIGIPADRHARLFEPFTQADESTTRRFGGTGLGLTITREIVALMGGTIGLDSEVGEGSSFWMSLPLEHRAEQPSSSSRLADHEVLAQVVEPRPLHREALVSALTWAGVQVEVFDRMRDVPMPREGAELRSRVLFVGGAPSELELEALLALREQTDLAVVSVTSLNDSRSASWRAASPTATLVQPVRHGQLLELLERLIEHRWMDEPSQCVDDLPAARAQRRILIVEDSPVNQLILKGALDGAGYDHATAANGLEAVEAFRDGSFDLVLIDCQMPVMDGFEATRRIRRMEPSMGVRTPIIALTANATEADRRACERAGMDDFMTKPYKLDVLIGRLDALLLSGVERAAS